MKIGKVLLKGAAATSMMTIFSYIVSEQKGKNFKEPQLLAALIRGELPKADEKFVLPAGWAAHFGAGFSFSVFCQYIFDNTKISKTAATAMALGTFGGLTGIEIWKISFRHNQNPPKTDFENFYRHVFIAHLIFALSFTLLSREFADKKSS